MSRELFRILGLILALSATANAHERAPAADPIRMQRSFPQGFQMGSAISGFQVDMGCPTLPAAECEDRHSDWFQFITHPQFLRNSFLFLSGDRPDKGPGFYELFPADLKAAKHDMGHNSLRFSIEWSRVFPRPTFGVSGYQQLRALASQEGLDYYHRMLAEMRRQGLSPLVTLNHYSLPTWIHDAAACNRNFERCANKGWADPDRIVPEIAKYAGFIAEEFGRDIDTWATLNEPFLAVVFPGYVLPSQMRSNPPGLHFHLGAAKKASRGMIEAHARMYDAVHAADQWDADGDGTKASVGLVSAYVPVHPQRPGTADETAARELGYLINDLYLDALVLGKFDEKWNGQTVDRPDLGGRMDFIGINYYMTLSVQKAWIPILKLFSPLLSLDPFQVTLEGAYPQGLYEVIADLSRYKRPMMVTETGRDAAEDDGHLENWLVRTMAWTRQAMADGYDVRGYYYWTLVDNYEWNIGMKMKMGLYAVDSEDPLKTRRPRSAVGAYQRIASDGAIPRELIEKHVLPPSDPVLQLWRMPELPIPLEVPAKITPQ